MNIIIPLHQDRQLPIGALVTLGRKADLHARAALAFTMINVADAAARKGSRPFPKDTIFGGFRSSFIKERLEAAYGEPKPPKLTAKQLRRIEAAEAYRAAVIDDQVVPLTNYEQTQWYRSGNWRGQRLPKTAFVGCRVARH